ncbi:MAG: nuclear transport factor 2 family protein, partial [Sphingobacteriales bacterium]
GSQLHSQTGTNSSFNVEQSETDRMTLSKLNKQFINDFLTNDTVAHNKIVYKDFVCINGNGTISNRNDYMLQWTHGHDAAVMKSFEMKNEFIRVYGNIALIRAETPYMVLVNGKEISGNTIYTDTYIKIDGRWWCIQAQLTPVK